MVYSAREVDDTFNLYIIRSSDGSSWSSPKLIEVVKSAEVLSVASHSQRSFASLIISLIVSIAVLVALIRLPFKWVS